MSQYTLYKLYKKQMRRTGDSSAVWVDVVPTTYSYNGDGTMTPVIVEDLSPTCGYVPPPEPQYRWVNLDTSININYYCEGTTKYYKQKKQISLDSGATWSDVTPLEFQKGEVAEYNSVDCGSIEPMYKWVLVTPTSDPDTYWCDECIEPFGGKFKAWYGKIDSYHEYVIGCVSDSTLTREEVCPQVFTSRRLVGINPQIGNCVTKIGYRCFNSETWKFFESIIIPNSVTEIGKEAFLNCEGLKIVGMPDSVTSIDAAAFSYCTSLPSVTIPDSVTSIGNNAFLGCDNLTSVTISNNLQVISNGVFDRCSRLQSVIIPNSVTKIFDYAFSDCSSLTSVTIPNTVTHIDDGVFHGCSSLPNITMPSGITEIYAQTFSGCTSLTSVNIPNGVTSIGDDAFALCSSLPTIAIPNTVTYIGNSAFKGCANIPSITIPSSVTTINASAFSGCTRLTNINIPTGVTSINEFTFSYCSSLPYITIPNSITQIMSGAFEFCTNLQQITIPSGVTSIGFDVFYGCTNLADIIVNATTPPRMEIGALYGTPSSLKIYVPSSSLYAYKSAEGWSEYSSQIYPI